jgi:hypothetical protein
MFEHLCLTASVFYFFYFLFLIHQTPFNQQVNKSRGDVAYNVIDVVLTDDANWSKVQKELTMIPEVRSSRFIFGASPLGGYGYAKNIPNKGYVV